MSAPAVDEQYRDAAASLRSGGVVALPTDTVFGLCARAVDDAAVERIYGIKRRDPTQPLPIFVADLAQAEAIGVLAGDVRTLAGAFWPGALTVVVPVRPGYRSRALAGQHTVALRVPGDERIRRLCAEAGPLTGTSANIAGREECHTAAEVRAQLGDAGLEGGVDLILDAPVQATAQPSTIVDCTQSPPQILRPGAIPESAIRAALARQ
jgi:L-threonylcarbamoyladenylate synthase